MASCPGKRRSTAICNSVVYRCENCTNVGCNQIDAGECSNQGFRSNARLMCGTIRLGEERLAMMPQLQEGDENTAITSRGTERLDPPIT